jgi:hypothetical protein
VTFQIDFILSARNPVTCHRFFVRSASQKMGLLPLPPKLLPTGLERGLLDFLD